VASEGWVNRLVHWLLVLGFKVFRDASSSDFLIDIVFQPRKLSGRLDSSDRSTQDFHFEMGALSGNLALKNDCDAEPGKTL
jgi:hypothetical protein